MNGSLLFLPASQPHLVPKLGRFRPDAAVLDLEDAVAEGDKAGARGMVAASAAAAHELGLRCLVRINAVGTSHFADDLAAVADSRAIGVVLPKYERIEDLDVVRGALGPTRLVVAGIESVLGVADARALLAAPVDAVYFGAEDYIADIGGRRTRDGSEVLYARSAVVAAAYISAIPAIDQAVVDIHDDAAFRSDAEAGRNLGYRGKICIHPRQVALTAEIFTPSPDDVRRAEQILATAGDGVATVEGQMVDAPHRKQARDLLARLGRAPGKETR